MKTLIAWARRRNILVDPVVDHTCDNQRLAAIDNFSGQPIEPRLPVGLCVMRQLHEPFAIPTA
ncbi:hypothetical protein AvCA_51500 [Azotobacter vinelandii CA]|uniref:Uncharacterized protein n=3 Tax=Azotobacter vinelandii TaxID=354 RepID=C1DMF0_AZOVD|nr:hypothetical protein Avin_51500 [Azotobacter vinelandii DJ]AGK14132.1 hypothetical protein AvCA_51500 [Azotobacter vinelandii CA]AGK22413.1 hypothetical protein AvCA6_51500 [Azotobacter vinelandii CA6]